MVAAGLAEISAGMPGKVGEYQVYVGVEHEAVRGSPFDLVVVEPCTDQFEMSEDADFEDEGGYDLFDNEDEFVRVDDEGLDFEQSVRAGTPPANGTEPTSLWC